jgi:hypothetical protein
MPSSSVALRSLALAALSFGAGATIAGAQNVTAFNPYNGVGLPGGALPSAGVTAAPNRSYPVVDAMTPPAAGLAFNPWRPANVGAGMVAAGAPANVSAGMPNAVTAGVPNVMATGVPNTVAAYSPSLPPAAFASTSGRSDGAGWSHRPVRSPVASSPFPSAATRLPPGAPLPRGLQRRRPRRRRSRCRRPNHRARPNRGRHQRRLRLPASNRRRPHRPLHRRPRWLRQRLRRHHPHRRRLRLP